MTIIKQRFPLFTGILDLFIYHTLLPVDTIYTVSARPNMKRPFHFVNKCLGKHLPSHLPTMRLVHEMLASLLLEKELRLPALFITFAEAATGFGESVFNNVTASIQDNICLLRTTRYRFNSKLAFQCLEAHSHAPLHYLYRPDGEKEQEIFDGAKTLVIIDDEFTTAKTASSLIVDYLKINPKIQRIIFLCQTNWLGLERQRELVNEFQCEVLFVSLLEGEYVFHPYKNCPDIPEWKSTGNDTPMDLWISRRKGDVRFGALASEQLTISGPTSMPSLPKSGKLLVLGTGEFNYLPFLYAQFWEKQGYEVTFYSTTRTPLYKKDAIFDVIQFKDNYNENIDNFIYNLRREDYDEVLVCYETPVLPKNHSLPEIINAQPVFFK